MKNTKALNWWVVGYVLVLTAVLALVSCANRNVNASATTTQTWAVPHVAVQHTVGYKCKDLAAIGRPQQVAAITPELDVSRQGDGSQLFINAGTRPDAFIKIRGNESGVVVVGDVAARAVVFAEGNNACIQIFGSIGDDAVIAISGSSGQIFVDGSVAPTARLCIEGGMSNIKVFGQVAYKNFLSTDPAFMAQVIGGGENVNKHATTVSSCRSLSPKLAPTAH